MENASKALLIAAAVLIVILLIALGVGVFNSSKGTVDTQASSVAGTINIKAETAANEIQTSLGVTPGT